MPFLFLRFLNLAAPLAEQAFFLFISHKYEYITDAELQLMDESAGEEFQTKKKSASVCSDVSVTSVHQPLLD